MAPFNPSSLVNRLPAHYGTDNLDVLNLLHIHTVKVIGQHDKIRQLPRGDRSFDGLLACVIGAIEVLTRSASSMEIFWLAPQVSPFHPVRVTIPCIAISGANGPGLKSEPAAGVIPASIKVRNAVMCCITSAP